MGCHGGIEGLQIQLIHAVFLATACNRHTPLLLRQLLRRLLWGTREPEELPDDERDRDLDVVELHGGHVDLERRLDGAEPGLRPRLAQRGGDTERKGKLQLAVTGQPGGEGWKVKCEHGIWCGNVMRRSRGLGNMPLRPSLGIWT